MFSTRKCQTNVLFSKRVRVLIYRIMTFHQWTTHVAQYRKQFVVKTRALWVWFFIVYVWRNNYKNTEIYCPQIFTMFITNTIRQTCNKYCYVLDILLYTIADASVYSNGNIIWFLYFKCYIFHFHWLYFIKGFTCLRRFKLTRPLRGRFNVNNFIVGGVILMFSLGKSSWLFYVTRKSLFYMCVFYATWSLIHCFFFLFYIVINLYNSYLIISGFLSTVFCSETNGCILHLCGFSLSCRIYKEHLLIKALQNDRRSKTQIFINS